MGERIQGRSRPPVLYAEGKHDDALKAMSAAPDARTRREASRDSGCPDAGARALRHDAARAPGMARRLSWH